MKTRAERLDEILAKFFDDLQADFVMASYRTVKTFGSYKDAKEKILAIFLECVPEGKEILPNPRFEYSEGFNSCRTETIWNMEKMRGE